MLKNYIFKLVCAHVSGILKNAPTPKLPEGFFDSETKNCSPPEPVPSLLGVVSSANDEEELMEADDDVAESKEPLPEGFFDDPVMDAKVYLTIVNVD